MASEIEVAAMRRAVALARRGLGRTNPNPVVGAVVLDAGGATVGEGFHDHAGGPHAEVVALEVAGDRARGGTLVVTLEPCRHTGRTGPCTDAIRSAGIARVVVGVLDPVPSHGGGARLLEDQGLAVETGVVEAEAAADNAAWLAAAALGRSHVTWKYAATLDGRVAAADGTSRWVTGSEARVDVHRERLLADAVVVGVGTVLADDPSLTARDWPPAAEGSRAGVVRQPLRVVVDSRARTPLTAAVLDGTAPTLVVTTQAGDPHRRDALAERAEVVTVGRTAPVDPHAVLRVLQERECSRVLLESGPTLAAAFVRAGLVDRVVGYVAPAVLGAGHPVLGDVGIATIGAARRWRVDAVDIVGGDVRITASTAGGR